MGSARQQWYGVRDCAVSLTRRWPISAFYLLTLAVSWPFGLLPIGPSLAAIPCVALLDGRAGVASLFRRVIEWRFGVSWYVIALCVPVALVLAAVGVNVMTGAELRSPASLFNLPELGTLFLLQVFGVFSGPWEELGWRGFLLPRLLLRHSPLVASLIVGFLWALWHVPLFVSGAVPWADMAILVPIALLFTAVFVRTKQSVLAAFLMHAALNAAAGVAVPLFEGGDQLGLYWSLGGVTTAVAVVMVALNPGWWSRRPPPVAEVIHSAQPRVVRVVTGAAGD